MDEQLMVGDVVKLRSGGPQMTVKYIEDKGGKTEVCCQWLADGKKH